MTSGEYRLAVINSMNNIADDLNLICQQYFNIDLTDDLKFAFKDEQENIIDIIEVDTYTFNPNKCDEIYTRLSNLLAKTEPEPDTSHEDRMGWRPISEYSREKYDWVLVKYFHESFECLPEVAEMRVDGKWYNRTGALIDPDIFDVKYFFDMQQLDREGE